MKKKALLLISVCFLILFASNVLAENQFQSIIDLIKDMLGLIAGVWGSVDAMSPKEKFGLFLFLLWFGICFAIYKIALLARASNNTAVMFGGILGTLTVVILNFQRNLLYTLVSGYAEFVLFLFTLAVALGLYHFAMHVVPNNPRGYYFIKAIIIGVALLICLSVSARMNDFLQVLDSTLRYYSIIAYFAIKRGIDAIRL